MIPQIRILDLDPGRLMVLEPRVKSILRRAGFKARVEMVSDNLAITRLGLLDKMPALEINGFIVSHSRPLAPERLKMLLQNHLTP